MTPEYLFFNFRIFDNEILKNDWSSMKKCRYLDAFLAYAGANMCLAVAAAALCAFIAPAVAGSGIPEVKAYLNGVDAQHILAPSTLFVKVNNTTILGASLPFLHKHTDKN
ncbi:Chloride channel protein CLC-c [Glycine soja]